MNPIIRTHYGREVPAPLTNDQRLQVFRALVARAGFNSWKWKFRA
jgi:hypothetical protein